jgi:integrase
LQRVIGFKFEKDTTEHLTNKFRMCLDTLKASPERTFTIDELILGMGYKNGRANRKAVEVVIYKLKSKGYLSSVLEQVEINSTKEKRLFIEQSVAMTTWMNRLSSDETKEKFFYLYKRYFDWIKTKNHFDSPDSMIANLENATTLKQRYNHITFIEDYFLESTLNANQKKSTYTSIRSFYKHNKAELPSYALKFKDKTTIKPIVTQQPITLEEIKQLLTIAKPREKAMYLIQLQSGMDRSTFSEYFNLNCWQQISKQLGNEDPELWDLSKAPIRIDLVRVKTRTAYYSFISTDAIQALQAWLNVRKTLTNKPMQSGEPLFITNHRTNIGKEQMSYSFNQLAISAGLESKKYGRASEVRYRFHSHELRDTFRTACTSSGVDHPVAEFFIGHSIDRLGYDKSPQVYPDYYRSQYMKVQPLLNIFSDQSLKEKKLEDLEKKISDKILEIEMLKQKNRDLSVVVLDLNKKMDAVVDFMNKVEDDNPEFKKVTFEAYKQSKEKTEKE